MLPVCLLRGVDHSASYFDHSDPDAKRVREALAAESLESLLTWLKREGNVGILGQWARSCNISRDIS